MKKTVNKNKKLQMVNPIGLLGAEPFQAKAGDQDWWARLNYGEKYGTLLIGPYADEQTTINILEHITE